MSENSNYNKSKVFLFIHEVAMIMLLKDTHTHTHVDYPARLRGSNGYKNKKKISAAMIKNPTGVFTFPTSFSLTCVAHLRRKPSPAEMTHIQT